MMPSRRSFFGFLSALLAAPAVVPVPAVASRATPWTAQTAYRGLNMRSEHIFSLPALFMRSHLQEIADIIDQKFGQEIAGLVMGPRAYFRYASMCHPNPMWCSCEAPFASAGPPTFEDHPVQHDSQLDVVYLAQYQGSFLLVRVQGSRR